MSDLADLIDVAVAAIDDQVVGWRRHLHSHPELSFQEYETSRFVAERLATLAGVEVERPTETGVIGRLRGGRPGPTLAIRADLDALPIVEQTGLAFASEHDGVMHACGHDGHTSILLAAATVLSSIRDQLPGELRFIFEPGEETLPGGAESMVSAGVMDGVDRVIGLHLWAPYPRGQLMIRPGRVMAACDVFEIVIKGKGGHIGLPHAAIDPIAIGAQVVSALQHIVAREVNPMEAAIVGITGFHGGGTIGVIPESVTLSGGTNVFSPEVQDLLELRIGEIATKVCEAHRATCSYTYTRGYRAVINDEALTQRVAGVARRVLGEAAVMEGEPIMSGEDYSAFAQRAPSCFILLGAGYRQAGIVPEHHNPRFDIDERALADGIRLFCHTAVELLLEDEVTGTALPS